MGRHKGGKNKIHTKEEKSKYKTPIEYRTQLGFK